MLSRARLRGELGWVGSLLAAHDVSWGVAAGAAVYLYTGNRPPTDLDLLVRPGQLSAVAGLLGVGVKRTATSWGEAEKLEQGEIEVVGRLEIRLGGERWPYFMDDDMVSHLRSVDLEGLAVPVLAPEDLVALKAALQRGPEQRKHDLEDIEALAGRVAIDAGYLRSRLELMGALGRARPVLEPFGW